MCIPLIAVPARIGRSRAAVILFAMDEHTHISAQAAEQMLELLQSIDRHLARLEEVQFGTSKEEAHKRQVAQIRSSILKKNGKRLHRS